MLIWIHSFQFSFMKDLFLCLLPRNYLDGFPAGVEEDITETMTEVRKQTSVHNITIHVVVQDSTTRITTL